MEKPVLIIPVSKHWSGSKLPIDILYNFDMDYLKDSMDDNPDWYEDDSILSKSLNTVITTDASWFERSNLKYFRDIILRKDNEFLSIRKVISNCMVEYDVDNMIENFKNLEFEQGSDYLNNGRKRKVIYKSLFPTLKKDLSTVYEKLKDYEYANRDGLYVSDICILCNDECIVSVCLEDRENFRTLFSTTVGLHINPNSEYLGWFSIESMLNRILKYGEVK